MRQKRRHLESRGFTKWVSWSTRRWGSMAQGEKGDDYFDMKAAGRMLKGERFAWMDDCATRDSVGEHELERDRGAKLGKEIV